MNTEKLKNSFKVFKYNGLLVEQSFIFYQFVNNFSVLLLRKIISFDIF